MTSWWSFGEYSGDFGNELYVSRLVCAFCEETGNFTLDHRATKTNPDSSKTLHFDTYKCGNCANFLMVFWSPSTSNHHQSMGMHAYRVLPWPQGKPVGSDNWPEVVKKHWVQAHDSLSRGNIDAAAVMARSTLQAAVRGRLPKEAVEDKARAGNRTFISLYDDIVALHESGLIPADVTEWAHEIRLFAQPAAHPNGGDEEVSEQDAEDMLKFIDFLLEYLYDLPAKIERYRARRSDGDAGGEE